MLAETMFRVTPWAGMGNAITEAPNSAEAIKLAGLDWEVKQQPSFIMIDDKPVKTGDIINYRDSDNSILGTVKDRYQVVQNHEAFEFTDALIENGDARYETAGSLFGGKVVWMLAKLPSDSVLGDEMDRFLLFSNSHDGSRAVTVTTTNIRVWCSNTLNMALANAKRKWTFVHKGDMDSKLDEAKKSLILADSYNEEFKKQAEKLAIKKVSVEQARKILDAMFPLPNEDISKTKLNHMVQLRENFIKCYNADDIADYKGTAWGMVNAFSDMIYHGGATLRQTKGYEENRLASVISGNTMFDKAYSLILAA
jgi:phage/plasmid-like protein (TIGR03299 family)